MSRYESRIVIVGGGAAGVTSADVLRTEGFTGRITIVSDEATLPYDRPPLSKKILTGELAPDANLLRQADWYFENNIQLLTGRSAAGLDIAAKSVVLSNGDSLDYESLIVATGVRARPLPGTEGVRGVHTVRSLADAMYLKDDLDGARSVLIIGAGFLGMEIASVASAGGRSVTVVDPLPRPLAAVFGPRVGDLVAELHGRNGVTLLTGFGVSLVEPVDSSVRVTLSDGRILIVDCVVVAIGAIPATEWLADSGLELERGGVVVDHFGQAAPDIYAAGDIAYWPSARYKRRMRVEHRHSAGEMASTVAFNIVHGNTRIYDPVPYFWSDQHGVRIQAYGVFGPTEEYEVIDGAHSDGRFVLADAAATRRVGVIGWNAPKLLASHAAALREGSHHLETS